MGIKVNGRQVAGVGLPGKSAYDYALEAFHKDPDNEGKNFINPTQFGSILLNVVNSDADMNTKIERHNNNEEAHPSIQEDIADINKALETIIAETAVVSESLDGSVSINSKSFGDFSPAASVPVPTRPWKDFTIELVNNEGFEGVSIQGKNIEVYSYGVNSYKAYAKFVFSLNDTGTDISWECTDSANPNSVWSTFPKTANLKLTGIFKNPMTVPVDFVTKDEFEELKTSVSDGKELIAAAVADKGIEAAGTETFQSLANKIEKIYSNCEAGVVNTFTDNKTYNQPTCLTTIENNILKIQIYPVAKSGLCCTTEIQLY